MTKICATCKIDKDLTEFHNNKANDDGLQYTCKECRKVYVRKHYLANKQSYIDRSSTSKKSMRNRFDELKSNYSCVVCGESDICCIDFHHIDPTTKEFGIGYARGAFSLEKIKSEIDKCIALCSNCHRKHHAGRLTLECKQIS